MGVVVRYTGRISQGVSKVLNHLKYIGFRSNENKEYEIREELNNNKSLFFTKDSDNKDYKEFLKDIEKNKALKHSKSVKAHKIVFSLREKDYDNFLKYGEGKNYRNLIRSTLDEYSRYTGKKLDWIATEHLTEGNKVEGYTKSKHPHVHVVIKGVTENNERVYFKTDDYKLMREIFDKEFVKVCDYTKSIDKGKLFDNMEKDFSKSISKVVSAIQKDVEKGFNDKMEEKIRLSQEKSRERERVRN